MPSAHEPKPVAPADIIGFLSCADFPRRPQNNTETGRRTTRSQILATRVWPDKFVGSWGYHRLQNRPHRCRRKTRSIVQLFEKIGEGREFGGLNRMTHLCAFPRKFAELSQAGGKHYCLARNRPGGTSVLEGIARTGARGVVHSLRKSAYRRV